MPFALRSRLALVLLLGTFLIPVGMSSLRGLTHVLTCSGEAETPFTLTVPGDGPPELVTSQRITREGPAPLCGGLALDLRSRVRDDGAVEMVVPITNRSPYMWKGTVELVVGGTSLPVPVGEIPAGATRTAVLKVPQPPRGTTDIEGSLLVGP